MNKGNECIIHIHKICLIIQDKNISYASDIQMRMYTYMKPLWCELLSQITILWETIILYVVCKSPIFTKIMTIKE